MGEEKLERINLLNSKDLMNLRKQFSVEERRHCDDIVAIVVDIKVTERIIKAHKKAELNYYKTSSERL